MTYRISLDDSTAGDVQQIFCDQGAVWLERVFSRRLIRQLSKIYFRKYASLAQSELESRYACVGDRRYMITTQIKGKFNQPDLYAHARLMPIFENLLGRHFVISSFGSVVAFPGADAQSVHFDYPPLYEDAATCAALPPHAITLVIPLVKLDSQKGGTALWLGSHRDPDAREKLQSLAESGSMKGSQFPDAAIGDAYLMDFRMIHAGLPNRSEVARPILYIVYSRPWFNESLNFAEQPPINLSAKQYQKIPSAYRHLFANRP